MLPLFSYTFKKFSKRGENTQYGPCMYLLYNLELMESHNLTLIMSRQTMSESLLNINIGNNCNCCQIEEMYLNKLLLCIVTVKDSEYIPCKMGK